MTAPRAPCHYNPTDATVDLSGWTLTGPDIFIGTGELIETAAPTRGGVNSCG